MGGMGGMPFGGMGGEGGGRLAACMDWEWGTVRDVVMAVLCTFLCTSQLCGS